MLPPLLQKPSGRKGPPDDSDVTLPDIIDKLIIANDSIVRLQKDPTFSRLYTEAATDLKMLSETALMMSRRIVGLRVKMNGRS